MMARVSRKRDREDLFNLALTWIPGVVRCRSCKHLHADGYVCGCGREEGDGVEVPWEEVEDLLRHARR